MTSTSASHDLPREQTAVMAATQRPVLEVILTAATAVDQRAAATAH